MITIGIVSLRVAEFTVILVHKVLVPGLKDLQLLAFARTLRFSIMLDLL